MLIYIAGIPEKSFMKTQLLKKLNIQTMYCTFTGCVRRMENN